MLAQAQRGYISRRSGDRRANLRAPILRTRSHVPAL